MSQDSGGQSQAPTVQLGLLRSSEWLLVIYFAYTAILAQVWSFRSSGREALHLADLAVPVALWLVAYADSLSESEFTSVVRDWMPAPTVLVAYWRMGSFELPHHSQTLERAWIAWDKVLLHDWGGLEAIERFGLAPAVLGLSYLLVYAIPPFCIFVLYIHHRRDRVDRFFFTFLLGTLLTYSLLPYFPSDPPRLAFPGDDAPAVSTTFRQITLWLLDRYDIRTSVFPSGHVTAAFSAAFAMFLVLPEKRWVGWALSALACSIAITTVYGRYHYAVDGLAGFAVSLAALGISASLYPAQRFAAATRISV